MVGHTGLPLVEAQQAQSFLAAQGLDQAEREGAAETAEVERPRAELVGARLHCSKNRNSSITKKINKYSPLQAQVQAGFFELRELELLLEFLFVPYGTAGVRRSTKFFS